jgi:transcriptional regulator with XRE-family HTH domain
MAKQMMTPAVPAETLAAFRQRAAQTRQQLEHKPAPAELLTVQELADVAPFYFALREYIQELKQARVAAGLTLADIAERTGLAVESLARLETGAQINPTWKTLGAYAAALGLDIRLTTQKAVVSIERDSPKSASAVDRIPVVDQSCVEGGGETAPAQPS